MKNPVEVVEEITVWMKVDRKDDANTVGFKKIIEHSL